jgi:hypothetical protein
MGVTMTLQGFIFLLFVIAAALAAFYFLVLPVLRARLDNEYVKWSTTLTGLRTRLAARFVWLSGAVVGIYDSVLPFATGQDWTPLTSRVPGWVWPLVFLAVGWIFSKLRSMTTGPAKD